MLDNFFKKKSTPSNACLYINIFKRVYNGYFTASIHELRQHQLYILIVFMTVKL
jgi:hypothetical protein